MLRPACLALGITACVASLGGACSSYELAPGATADDAGNSDAGGVVAEEAGADASAPDAQAIDAGTRYEDLVHADGPLHYFRFNDPAPANAVDQGTSSGMVASYSFQNAIGCIAAQPSALPDEQTTDRAMKFGGACYLPVAQAAAFADMSPFTIEAWIMPASAQQAASGIVADDSATAPNEGWSLILASNDIVQFARGGALLSTPVSIPVGQWTHVAAIYDQVGIAVFINGTIASNAPVSGSINAGSGLLIGARNGPTSYFGGQLDEVAIYDHALTGARIKAHYDAASAP